MKRALKILGVVAAVCLVIVASITGLGMYLNSQDASSCADLYPTDWAKYEACRDIVQKLKARRRIFI